MGKILFINLLGDLIVLIYKYAWVVIFLLLLVLLIVAITVSVIQKRRLVKKESQKHSALLKMSYEGENEKGTARRIDGDTPSDKKYCPLCHSLTDKQNSICSVCGYEFKNEEEIKDDD